MRPVKRYGIDYEQLSPFAQAAAQAAERTGARTFIQRSGTSVAVIVPLRDLPDDGAVDWSDGGEDPLLALCGAAGSDVFVDALVAEWGAKIVLKRR